MKTPCQERPDLWVSDDRAERLAAKAECLTCWRLTECGIEVSDMRRRKLPVFGVAAGVDWTRTTKAAEPDAAPSTCGHCDKPITQRRTGARRQWCSEECGYHGRRAARAAA
jgi:hypothetical protein